MNPKILYHYTSLDALVSILDSEDENITLRATQAKFFNDSSDCKYYSNILLKTYSNLEIKGSKKSKEEVKMVFDSLQESYITSFSENSDDLTMWRGYGVNGLGISIGFNFDLLSKKFNKDFHFLIKSEYSKENLLIESTNIINKMIEEDNFSEMYNIILCAFKAKNPKYQHENEWRLCHINSNLLKIKFRSTGKTIVPYIENNIPKSFINEILIGPCLNEELIKEGIILILQQRNFDLSKIKVKTSKVPYRLL